ncbi:MAG: sensor histidine kinase [Kiritimatiellae bacterium]|nr:sensor histidine kinase [Kiritimatiellia bacterium]
MSLLSFSCTSLLIASYHLAITNLVEIEKCRMEVGNSNRTFKVCAPVFARLDAEEGLLLLGDSNGIAQFDHLLSKQGPVPTPGDIVKVSGVFEEKRRNVLYAVCREMDIVGHGAPPSPKTITPAEFLSGRFDYRLSRITGTVKDIFPDELDANYSFMVIQAAEETLYAACRNLSSAPSFASIHTGCQVSLVGIPLLKNPINWLHLGRYFHVPDPKGISVTRPVSAADANLPDLREVLLMRPQEISKLGRHRAVGRVLSVMRDGSFLMRTKENLVVRVGVGERNLPKIGETIEAVGFPESNLYYLDLIRSSWHPSAAAGIPDPSPVDVDAEAIMHFSNGRPVVDSRYHGRLVRLSGRILSLPDSNNADNIMMLECRNQVVPIDIGNIVPRIANLSKGCVVKTSGICVLDVETWRPNAAFPHIRGFTIVPRSEQDLHIVSRPPWWTPRRLLVVLCILVPVILASIALNLFLRRLVERRSRALLKEQSAKLVETLRVDERTRLAAELHDSVAQDLSGISMQIETAEDLASGAPEKLRRILGMASRSLLNCREELRNCLWDLRSHALDEQNIGDAIMRTLKPHLEGSELSLCFDVPRSLVSDATAHTTLRIVRELVNNAIRHGRARHLRICGAIDSKRLAFSVSDDGCGFDPDTAPGAAQGHFGLAGVRERIRKLGGTVTFRSTPGKGTEVAVTI